MLRKINKIKNGWFLGFQFTIYILKWSRKDLVLAQSLVQLIHQFWKFLKKKGRRKPKMSLCTFHGFTAKTNFNPSISILVLHAPLVWENCSWQKDENKWELACVLLMSRRDLSQNFLLAKADLSIYIKVTVFFLSLVPFWFTFFLIDSLLPGVLKITPQILEWLWVLFGSSSGRASSWPHSF